MNHLSLVGAALVSLALAVSPCAAENPQIAALENQIKALRAEEKAAQQTIHNWYTGFIKRTAYTEAELAAERKVLTRQEEALLSAAATKEQRQAIHTHFDTLRGALTGEIKLDDAMLDRLRALRKAHENHVAKVYEARIDQVQAQIKVLKASPKK